MTDPIRPAGQLVSTTDAALPAPALPPWNATPGMWLDSHTEAEGFNFKKFLHSLRRTWLVGVLAGLVIAATTGGALWLLIPESYEAFGLLRVKLADKELMSGHQAFVNEQEFMIFKETQAGLVKSPFIISRAIRPDEIRQFSILQDLRLTPEKYLENELDVSFPNRSEIMKVALRGSNPEELKTVVNAVINAYLEEFNNNVSSEKAYTLQELQKQYNANLDRIQEEEEELHDLSKQIGADDTSKIDARQTIELDALRSMARQRDELALNRDALQTEIILLSNSRQTNQFNPSRHLIADFLEADPSYMEIKRTMKQLETEMSMMQGQMRQGSPTQQRFQMSMDMLEKDLRAREKELMPRIKERIRQQMYGIDENQQNMELRQKQIEFQIATERLKGMDQSIAEQTEKLVNLKGFSAVLVTKMEQLEHLKETNAEIAAEISRNELSLKTEPRVQRLQQAEVPKDNDVILRMLGILATSIAAFGLTVVGFAGNDYLRNLMSTAGELERETNISVIGKLPNTAGRAHGFFGGPRFNESLVGDYVDSIRAAITRGDKAKDVDSVLVTSATGKEGKTSLASQLAVSFARGGKRTVLVDGDVRNPHQHLVFGLPADRGLCDIIRGEATVQDVVQATPAENLWILPAGHFDISSQHGLNGQVVGDLLADLRDQFDFVVIDSAPVLTGPESMMYGHYISGAILVTRQDFSSLDKVDEAQRRLRSVNIRIFARSSTAHRRNSVRLNRPYLPPDDVKRVPNLPPPPESLPHL